ITSPSAFLCRYTPGRSGSSLMRAFRRSRRSAIEPTTTRSSKAFEELRGGVAEFIRPFVAAFVGATRYACDRSEKAQVFLELFFGVPLIAGSAVDEGRRNVVDDIGRYVRYACDQAGCATIIGGRAIRHRGALRVTEEHDRLRVLERFD